MAASPDWRTWFPAPAWLPRDAAAACEVAQRHLRDSGMTVLSGRASTHFRVQAKPAGEGHQASIRVEFRLTPQEGLRVRYRPAPDGRWASSVFAPVVAAVQLLRASGPHWSLAVEADRSLRAADATPR